MSAQPVRTGITTKRPSAKGGRRSWLLVVAAAALCVTAACGGGTDAKPTATATTTSSSIPAARPTTSTTAAPAAVVETTTKPPAKGGNAVATTKAATKGGNVVATTKAPPTGTGDQEPIDRFTRPGDAARHLYDAWLAGSRPRALEAAAELVVDDLFSYPVPQDTLTPGECELVEVGYGCHWAGERSRLVMIVEGGASAGYRVVWASLHRPPVYSDDGVPQVVVRPEQAAVGRRVRIDGYGFEGERFSDPSSPLYLVGGPPGCLLYAPAEHSVTVREDGYLSGEFEVPEEGECRMREGRETVRAGHFSIGFGRYTDIIGQVDVTEV